jgi:hypothetical protein
MKMIHDSVETCRSVIIYKLIVIVILSVNLGSIKKADTLIKTLLSCKLGLEYSEIQFYNQLRRGRN